MTLANRQIRGAAFGVVMISLLVGPLMAQGAYEQMPPGRAVGVSFSLDAALRNVATISLAEELYRLRQGQLQVETGAFDLTLIGDMSYERSQGALTASAIRDQFDRRDFERVLIREFNDLREQIRETGLPFVNCDSITSFNLIDPDTGQVVIDACRDQLDIDNLEIRQEILEGLLGEEGNSSPEVQSYLDSAARQLQQLAILTTNVNAGLESQIVAAEQRLLDLGVIPEIEKRYTLLFDWRLAKPTRSGTVISGGLLLQSVQDNFDGKSLLPQFGGKGAPNTFQSFLGLQANVPLGRGGGYSASAFEKSSGLQYQAAIQNALHTNSRAAVGALRAYWRAAAARDRLELVRRSSSNAARVLEITTDLVTGDAIPRSDQTLAEARNTGAVLQELNSVIDFFRSRVDLADAMGVGTTLEELPNPVEALPEIPPVSILEELAADVLSEFARNERRDLRSLESLEEATRVLFKRAKRDMRRRLDLSIAVGYSGLHESFSDEIYDLGGFEESLSGDLVGPSVFFSLAVDFPVRNRAAKGRLEEARALAQQAQITRSDTQRAIASRINDLTTSLVRIARASERRAEAVDNQRETYAATQELFRAGEVNIVDTILTEEQLLSAELQLLAAREAYSSTLAELLFETANLLVIENRDGVWTVTDFRTGIEDL